jgi:hypothetical protein
MAEGRVRQNYHYLKILMGWIKINIEQLSHFPVFRFATPDLKTDPEEKQSLQKIF